MADEQLTMADADKVIQVSPGDTVTITLDQTASTGYRWSIDDEDESILELQGDEKRASPEVGSKGSVDWTFRARKPGTAKLRLKLWREWEGDKSVIERFEATVQVR